MGEREIPTREQWVLDIKSRVEEHESLLAKEREARQKHSIYKLPEAFISDERRRRAYKPQVVSLGPYHHNDKDDDLKAMEEHKARALRHFLVRTNKSICDCLDALRGEGGEVVKELMGAYNDLGGEWKDEERFLRPMILDGCFLREVLKEAEVGTAQADVGRWGRRRQTWGRRRQTWGRRRQMWGRRRKWEATMRMTPSSATMGFSASCPESRGTY